MPQIPWYLIALAAAVIWGLHYPLIDHALKKVSLVSVLLLTAIPVVLIAPLFAKTIVGDYRTLVELERVDQAAVLALGLTSLSATVLLFWSINSKNATFSSLIEIAYPAFVALFAYLLFRDVQVNASVLFGALLVFSGVAVIILNNP